MSDESMEIPFEADLAPLQAAIDRVVAAIDKMAATITSAFDRANTSINASVSKMNAFQTGTSSAAAASHQMTVAATSMSAKIMQAASAAGSLGHAATGMKDGLEVASKAVRFLRNSNLASTLSGWITRAGGIRGAFRQIPAAMSAIASNPVFRRVAAGAVIAVGGILAIRTAWRTVTGAFSLARNTITSSFRGIVTAARSAAAQAGNAFKGLASMPGKLMGSMGGALPFAGVIGGLGGLAGAATLAVSSINKAAEMETLQTAFAPLLGGADAAKARIAELSAFAASTPFELTEVAKASRVLETLTKGALATGDGLRLVGDIAATTQQPFEEIAMWVGRLYDGLQSGRPVGEATARLQELGVISGEVRGKLEGMQKTGAAGAAIWAEAAGALNRFSGSMERQSVTWSGKLSTLRDNISLVMSAFGTPIIDGLKPYLDMVIAKVASLQDAGKQVGEKIKEGLDFAMAAFQTGSIIQVIGSGLEMAILNGINTLIAGFKGGIAYLQVAITGIAKGFLKALMQSGIVGFFTNLAQGLAKTIEAGILAAIAKITGWKSDEIAAEDARKQAGFSFDMAKYSLENLDFTGALNNFAEDTKNALIAGDQAFQKAKGDPFLDDSESAQKWVEGNASIRDRMKRNQEDADNKAKALDEKLKANGAGSLFSAPAALKKAVERSQPQFTSLGRIGGGGFSSMSPMISEQKRTNGLLTRIVNNTAGNKSTPVIA